MQNLRSTLRYTLRQFRMAPVFTAAATLTLALGIGGTTAIFTIIHAVMLRSLPVSDPALLYRIGDGDDCCVEGGPQDRWGMFSFPLYERLKAQTPEFEEVAAFQAGGGRLLSPNDDKPSAPPVVVLSHRTWQTEYGADPSVVGASFSVDGHPFTVIGVTRSEERR